MGGLDQHDNLPPLGLFIQEMFVYECAVYPTLFFVSVDLTFKIAVAHLGLARHSSQLNGSILIPKVWQPFFAELGLTS